MGRDLARLDAMREDIAVVDGQIERLLAASAGQILTTLSGVATTRAAALAAHTLPVERFATPEHLYSATGPAPASDASSTVRRRGGISRTGLPEHRDALIGITWGLGQFAPAFQQRLGELRARGKTPLEARVLTAHTKACRTTAPDQPADLTGPPQRPRRRSTHTPRSPPAATAPAAAIALTRRRKARRGKRTASRRCSG